MARKTSVLRASQQASKAERQATQDAKTADSFQNFAARLGMGTDNLMSWGSYGFNPITRNRQLLEWIHRGSWLGGVAVDVVADDMTRAGVSIQGELPPDLIAAIEEEAVALGIWSKLASALKWSRLYGGSIVVYLIDGQDLSTPLRLDRVAKSQFRGLLPLDRWMVEPSLNNLVEDFGPQLGQPKFYRVLANSPALRGATIHYSRVIRLEGIELPYQQKLVENLWGLSVIERLYDRLVAFDSATTGASQLVFKSFLRTVNIEGLRDVIAQGGPAMEGLLKYMDMMRRFQSIEGVTMLDAKDQFAVQGTVAYSGMDGILLQLGQQISGALQIPLVRLFGQSPAGLSATGESDLRTYYDGIAKDQNRDLKVPITAVYRMMVQNLGVGAPDGFGVAFNPLWQLTDAEKAQIAQVDTQTAAEGMEMGIPPATILRELKQSGRTTGRWTNITDEDIQMAEAVPPPMLQAALAAEEGGEEEGGEEPPVDEDPNGNPPEAGPGKKGSARDAEFKESDHPRKNDGKFAPQGTRLLKDEQDRSDKGRRGQDERTRGAGIQGPDR